MKKKGLLTLLTVMMVVLSVLPGAAQAEKPAVVFVSPEADAMWNGVRKIKLRLKNIDPEDVQAVELYLDGRLLKEFTAPPYVRSHTFDAAGQNRNLKAVVRGEGFKVLARATLLSYQVDEAHAVEVNQVLVPVVVTDKKGNYVRSLKKEDFQLAVDGRPVAISYFKPGGATRFNMAQVIDISGSMRFKQYDVFRAAGAFMRNLMTENDRGTLVFFNHVVFDHLGFTSDVKELSSRLELQTPASGETALLDAMAYTVNLMSKNRDWNIMVIFSDGYDNSSYIDRFSLLEKVKKSAVVVYAIDNTLDGSQDILAQACELSGGMTFPLANVKKTNEVFKKIRADIKSQYVLFFNAPKGKARKNTFHSLTVKVKGKNYKVRTLKGYAL